MSYLPMLLGLGAIALLGWLFFVVRKEGVLKERLARADADRHARDVADEVQNDIGALPPAEAREELRKWQR